MKRSILVMLVTVAVIATVGSAKNTTWNNAAGDHSYTNSVNWNLGTPVGGDTASYGPVGAEAVISTSVNADGMNMGLTSGVTSNVRVANGGHAHYTGSSVISYTAGSAGNLIIDAGGTMDIGWQLTVGQWGSGTVTLNGGTLTCQHLCFNAAGASNINAVHSFVDVKDGGTLQVNTQFIVPTFNASGPVINVSGTGKLLVKTTAFDVAAANAWANAGYLTGNGLAGAANIIAQLATIGGVQYTQIAAVPAPLPEPDPAPSNPKSPIIYYLNLTSTSSLPTNRQYDIRHVAACLQGLVNREAPRVFISFIPDDVLWLTRLRQPGGLCEGWNVVEVATLEDLISRMRSFISGVVLYDPALGVCSTSLVATTVAGVENCLAVRKDTGNGSMYNYLVLDAGGPQFNVLFDLTGKFTGSGTIWQSTRASTGSAKCDAYIWAKEKYIDTGKCDPTVLSYTLDLWGLTAAAAYPDRWQLTNLDYAVSRKAFCFELSPWGTEKPNDDPAQPLGTDLNTFKEIMNACNLQTGKTKMIKFCGFTNWWYKYTATAGGGGTKGDVDTENETIKLQTAYNCYAETEAPGLTWISNSSFYSGLMPAVSERRYVQNPPPTYDSLVAQGFISAGGQVVPGNYIMLAMDDYDSAAWILYWLAGDRYNSTSRGLTYCNWGITPSLCDRASVAMDYMHRNKTSKDFFMACVGYVNPTKLYGSRSPSGYPSGVPLWQEHNRGYYRLFDYSISGWLLNGSAGNLSITDCQNYEPFSGDGIGLHEQTTITKTLSGRSPVCRKEPQNDPSISNIINNTSGVNFGWYRTTLWTPRQIRDLVSSIESSGFNRRCVDMYTFYYLLRYNLGGNNNYRATWVDDTIPRVMTAGQTYPITVTVRNDGWDTWNEDSMYRLGYAIVAAGVTPSGDYDNHAPNRFAIPGGANIAPGQTVTFSFNLPAPSNDGNYDLYYDMVKDGVTWFRNQANIEWKKKIVVATDVMSIDTDSDGCPDVVEQAHGMLYWNPDDGLSKKGDLNCDGIVDFIDISILAQSWLKDDSTINIFPVTAHGTISFEDFSRIASFWLTNSY